MVGKQLDGATCAWHVGGSPPQGFAMGGWGHGLAVRGYVCQDTYCCMLRQSTLIEMPRPKGTAATMGAMIGGTMESVYPDEGGVNSTSPNFRGATAAIECRLYDPRKERADRRERQPSRGQLFNNPDR